MDCSNFSKNVFVNCPLDEDFKVLKQVIIFCIVYAGLNPRLSTERLESGEQRLEKIIELISSCATSVHDLSMCQADKIGEYARMNMPFELGLDMGIRKFSTSSSPQKKFVIFEKNQYDLKKAISDLSGADVEYHQDDVEVLFKKLRDFLKVEVSLPLPGAAKIMNNYIDFCGWLFDKKILEGHRSEDIYNLPDTEWIDEASNWVNEERGEIAP